MDESASWMLNTLELCLPNTPEKHVSLASTTPALAVNSNVFIQSVYAWNEETELSASSNTLNSSYLSHMNHESTGTSHDEHQPSGSDNAKLEPPRRKGHTKSRRGCYNCKKRRVKCPENRPTCTQCARRCFECKWPELYINQGEVVKLSPTIPQQVELSIPVFNMRDFRLFHHFIHDAYPIIEPIDDESIWTHEIPCIAHNYNFLLHAMLALSASDIEATSRKSSPELAQSAIFHRILAIKYFNRALSAGLHTFEEGNAMLATCWVLLYQSILIDEGLSEYLTFVRGCVLVPLQMGSKDLKFLFKNLFSDDEIEKTRPSLQDMPAVNLRSVDAACTSLEALKPLCEREVEKKVQGRLLELVRRFYLSSCDGYISWLKGPAFFACHINHAEFQSFINPSNVVGQLLLSHLVAITTLITPIKPNERAGRKTSHFANGMVRWLEVAHANIDPSMRSYIEWPIKRADEVREWLQYEGALAT